MSVEEKKKTVKVKKIKKVEFSEPVESAAPMPDNDAVSEKKEPKKRASRAKKQPTKEELMKMLNDGTVELKQIIQDLKDDEMKLYSVQGLKRVPELMKETLSNLEEDLKEIGEQIKELTSLPETPSE